MSSVRPLVVILTETFPFQGPDQAFLVNEVESLRHSFDIWLVPVLHGAANSPLVYQGQGVFVMTELSDRPAGGLVDDLWGAAKLAFSRAPTAGVPWTVRAKAVFARRLRRVHRAQDWAKSSLLPQIRSRECVVYSWWGFPEAFGTLQALQGASVPMVVRMHGYDLYPERDRLGFVPFQREMVDLADRVFTASEAGASFLQGVLPEHAEKIRPIYLGVSEPESKTEASTDGQFRVVTCSSAVPVKRLDRMVEVVRQLRMKDRTIRWTHIGDGPELAAIRIEISDVADCIDMVGHLPHSEVLTWLSNHPIDLFCNVSDSEGLPVSLMEAAACGIPLLARDVGGNGEIVDDEVGLLLSGDSEANEIAIAVETLMDMSEEERRELRRASHRRWDTKFRADANYAALHQELTAMCRGI